MAAEAERESVPIQPTRTRTRAETAKRGKEIGAKAETHKTPIDWVPPSAENAPHDKSRQLSLSPTRVANIA